MPSTYSTSLRLELMATGEKDNTWGQITNTNLGTLLESAIAGVANVTHDNSANYTLTTLNGGDDEARHMVLVIGGTLTAARNVICPAVEKLYFVHNNTSGGFDITIKTSGGTGVTVPNGKTMVVYCDGTNVLDAVTNLPAGATIGGSSPVTESGTATFTNKTIDLANNTLTGTTAQFNAALSDGDFATLAGVETLTNKTMSFASNTFSATLAELNAAVSDANLVPDTRTVTGTGGLTGGGALSTNQSISIAAGGVTSTHIAAGAVGTTAVADNAVTLAKLADMATSSFLGRVTAGTGDPEVLSGTQATALLDTFTTTAKGLVPAPGSATGKFLKDDGTWASSGGGWTQMTAQTASGTSVDFTGIPPTAKVIKVLFVSVSLDDNKEIVVQIGPSGGVETSGYRCTIRVGGADYQAAAYCQMTQGLTSGNSVAGFLEIANLSGNTWVFSGVSDTFGLVGKICGKKTLAGALSIVRVTTTGATTNFDAGTINVLYQ